MPEGIRCNEEASILMSTRELLILSAKMLGRTARAYKGISASSLWTQPRPRAFALSGDSLPGRSAGVILMSELLI